MKKDEFVRLLGESMIKVLTENGFLLTEMGTMTSLVGPINNRLHVQINPKEGGNIPHFHVTGNNFDTCIMFKDNRYFTHNRYADKLNASDRRDLVSFLKRKWENGWTAWYYMILTWNRLNPDNKLEKDMSMPDYTIIKNYK